MAYQTYTLTNLSSSLTATIRRFEIQTNPLEQQHTLNLGGWLSPFGSLTAFQGTTTQQSVTTNYVSDIRDVQRTNTVLLTTSTTTLVLNTNQGVLAGYAVTATGLGLSRTVASVTGTQTVILSQESLNPINSGSNFTFIPPEYLLTVASTAGLQVGWIASGNGYDQAQNTAIVEIRAGNQLKMTDQPVGSTTVGVGISFLSNNDIMYQLQPQQSVTFQMDYTRVTGTLGTYNSLVTISADQGGPTTKLVRNFMLVSALPVSDPASPYYDPGGAGGGGDGGGAGGGCDGGGGDGGGCM